MPREAQLDWRDRLICDARSRLETSAESLEELVDPFER